MTRYSGTFFQWMKRDETTPETHLGAGLFARYIRKGGDRYIAIYRKQINKCGVQDAILAIQSAKTAAAAAHGGVWAARRSKHIRKRKAGINGYRITWELDPEQGEQEALL